MANGVSGLTRATLRSAPAVCQECVWWQSRGTKTAAKDRWIDRVEEEWGEWGTIYLDEGGRLLGTLQYGPSHFFPRAADLPAGPPSDDAVVVTCTYLMGDGAEWVEKSLVLAAIGECRDRGARALEAFAYRYPPGETVEFKPGGLHAMLYDPSTRRAPSTSSGHSILRTSDFSAELFGGMNANFPVSGRSRNRVRSESCHSTSPRRRSHAISGVLAVCQRKRR